MNNNLLDITQYDFISPNGDIIYDTFEYKGVNYVKLSQVEEVAKFQDMLDIRN